MRTYSEMIQLPTFEERVKYLRLSGMVGQDTFGFDRYLNQMFYKDAAWRRIRREVILRDNGFDLGCKDRPIGMKVIVHHIEPMTKQDVLEHSDLLLNPNNLVCCSPETHRLIHYGLEADVETLPIDRTPFDTCPWRTKFIGELVDNGSEKSERSRNKRLKSYQDGII